MALLNPPEILPPLLRPVLEMALAQGKPVDDEKLVELLSPGEEGQAGSIGRAGNDSVIHTHTAARTLGLLKKEDRGSVPDPSVADSAVRGSLRTVWPTLLRRALLEHPSVASAVTEASAGDTTGARDLLFALTWFLAQDAFDAPLAWEGGDRNFQSLQKEHFGDITTDHAIQNDTRFGSFERWSLHLGFAVGDEMGKRALRPAPVAVVRDVVKGWKPGSYEIDDFCARLGEAVPCLWPGPLRQQLVAVIGSDPDPDVVDGIDSSVGFVLLALDAEGIIRLATLADAAQRRVIAPRSSEPRAVTHVEVLA